MRFLRSTVLLVLAMAWLLLMAAKNVIVSFTDEIRSMLGEDGEPISIIMFLSLMAASVVLVGMTGTLMALLKIIKGKD